MPEPHGPESQREMLSLVTARVRDAYVRKPFYVDGGLDLVSVCRLLSQQGLTVALVKDVSEDGDRLGIFTTTDLRDALLRAEPPARLAVREVARFGLIEIDAETAERLERVAPSRSRKRSAFVRAAILRALDDLAEREMAEAYAREPDDGEPPYLDPAAWSRRSARGSRR